MSRTWLGSAATPGSRGLHALTLCQAQVMQVIGERQGRILAGASGCITSVHVMPPVDLFEARRCTYIPTIPTVYRRTH